MELHGVGVGRGVVVGTVRRMPDPLPEPADLPFRGDPVLEFESVLTAQKLVAQELLARGTRAGAQARAILDAVAMMAEDPSLIAQVRQHIDAGKTGERAVFEAFAGFEATLGELGSRFVERAIDLGVPALPLPKVVPPRRRGRTPNGAFPAGMELIAPRGGRRP